MGTNLEMGGEGGGAGTRVDTSVGAGKRKVGRAAEIWGGGGGGGQRRGQRQWRTWSRAEKERCGRGGESNPNRAG